MCNQLKLMLKMIKYIRASKTMDLKLLPSSITLNLND